MYIQTAEALVWVVLVTVALAAAGGILSAVRARARRHARYRHYLQASRERERTTSAPSPLTGGMTPELAQGIRAHAERTAARYWNAGALERRPANPYEPGTPEYVLWYASYELALAELVDASTAFTVRSEGR